MNQVMNQIFYIRKSRANANNEFPIFARITILGERWDFSTGIKTEITKRCNKSYKIKGNSEATRLKNSQLTSLVLYRSDYNWYSIIQW